jgi:hypothetical protein
MRLKEMTKGLIYEELATETWLGYGKISLRLFILFLRL